MTKPKQDKSFNPTPDEHIRQLVEWMSHGVYEKEQIIAVALLCAVAGENMFLIGPPGTAKSMVASRLKMVFKGGKSFDYLMSRFSTPDEIFGPISISRLKNEDRYERLTAGYLPEADVVFLDEIWKAGPSIQNTLLTVINEHIFHNGGQIMHTPMKVLIAASNELPAKDEGLEALWDRFLVRMVSNCIENDTSFFKMVKGSVVEQPELAEHLFISDELYSFWQNESKTVGIHESVVNAIKAIRKSLASLEKDDGNQLRYYVSDRRWRKAYRLMQTSAYLNGRREINMSDYLLLIHCFWNDVECIPKILDALTTSISDSVINQLNEIDTLINQMMNTQKTQSQALPSMLNQNGNDFEEFEYFYYIVENYPGGETYFSKWDYTSLPNNPRDGIIYFDQKKKKNIIHTLINDKASNPLVMKSQRVKLQQIHDGIMINGKPYFFRKKDRQQSNMANTSYSQTTPLIQQIHDLFNKCATEWDQTIIECFTNAGNIFLSPNDYSLINKTIKKVSEQIRIYEVKISNITNMIK